MKLQAAIILACVAAACVIVFADTVHLRDGTKIDGTIKRSPDGWRVTLADGTIKDIAADDVQTIVLSGSAAPTTTEADGRLYSFRKSIERLTDPAAVIERYRRFIDQHAGTPIADDARDDLAVWEDRLARGLIRVGDEWATPERVAELREQAFAIVGEARRHVKDNRTPQANALVADALKIDPDNVSALYLLGIISHEREQTPAARKAFERVASLSPNHAPTLNNLAVVLWRQNQHAAALNRYDEAMLASPEDGDILDNVAEALHALPANIGKGAVAERVRKRFIEQDAKLQKRLEPMGLYRLGSGWASADELRIYRAAEKKVMDQLDVMARDFDQSQTRVEGIDAAIAENERELDKLPDVEYVDEWTGVRYRSPRYRALTDENARLVLDRDRETERLQAIRATALEVEKQLPQAPYLGEQKIIGPEGTPLTPVDAAVDPTTLSTTAR